MCFLLSFPPDFEGGKLSPWPFVKGMIAISVWDWCICAASLKACFTSPPHFCHFQSVFPKFMSFCRNNLTLGCRDGAVVRALASHQCGAGSIPISGVICGLSLLVLYSAPRGFLWVLRFPLSSKTNI